VREKAKVKGGLASSFGHDHKGIRRFEAAHMEAVAAWATCGGREGQVARGGLVGTATRWWCSHDRCSLRTRTGRCRFERVGIVALGRVQFKDPNRFPFIQIASKLCNSNSLHSQGPNIFKLCKVLYFNMMNNFVHWLNFQFPLYLMI
jgi:hypothetical protein